MRFGDKVKLEGILSFHSVLLWPKRSLVLLTDVLFLFCLTYQTGSRRWVLLAYLRALWPLFCGHNMRMLADVCSEGEEARELMVDVTWKKCGPWPAFSSSLKYRRRKCDDFFMVNIFSVCSDLFRQRDSFASCALFSLFFLATRTVTEQVSITQASDACKLSLLSDNASYVVKQTRFQASSDELKT